MRSTRPHPGAEELAAVARDVRGADPYAPLRRATVEHRRAHGCSAYAFDDGRILVALAHRLEPARVLELGTAVGYTACCWADAGASVDTVEGDAEHVRLARANLVTAGASDRVTVHEGRFEQVLPGLAGPYDVVFFDGYAPSPDLLEAMRARLARPGLLVTANLHLAGGDIGRVLRGWDDARTLAVDDDVALTVVG